MPAPVLIAAHSLGCIATARLPAKVADRIACCSRCSNPRTCFMHKHRTFCSFLICCALDTMQSMSPIQCARMCPARCRCSA